MKKKLLYLFVFALIPVLSACGDDDPQYLFDWFVTKSIYNKEGGKTECIKRSNEYVYNKTEEYMKLQKAEYEDKSTKYTEYHYSYSKI